MTPPLRIGELLKPPPPSRPPAQILRWVIQVTLLMSVLSTTATIVLWVVSAPAAVKWAMTIATLLSISSIPSLRRAMREAERRGPQDSPAEVAYRRRRGKRALWGMVAFYVVGFPIFGYLVDGAESAFVFFILALIIAVLSLGWHRHFSRG